MSMGPEVRRDFANRLRGEGIEAEIDQFIVQPPEGWTDWMARQIRELDFTLLVCTETYLRRVNGDEEYGRGLGVRWEGKLIHNAIYRDAGHNRRFVPVYFEPEDKRHVPDILFDSNHFCVTTEDGWHRLLLHLDGQPAAQRAPLGVRNAVWTGQPGPSTHAPAEAAQAVPVAPEPPTLELTSSKTSGDPWKGRAEARLGNDRVAPFDLDEGIDGAARGRIRWYVEEYMDLPEGGNAEKALNAALQTAVDEDRPFHAVHFDGHGTTLPNEGGVGALCFENDDGGLELVAGALVRQGVGSVLATGTQCTWTWRRS